MQWADNEREKNFKERQMSNIHVRMISFSLIMLAGAVTCFNPDIGFLGLLIFASAAVFFYRDCKETYIKDKAEKNQG